MEEKLEKEVIKYSHDLVSYWISNADNKLSTLCGLFTIVFSLATFISEKTTGSLFLNTNISKYRIVVITTNSILLVGLVLSFTAICYCLLSIIPNIGKNEGSQKKRKYPIFYGEISEITNEEYKSMIESATDSDFYDELVNETHYNSIIAKKKMTRLKNGIKKYLVAMLIFIIGTILKIVYLYFLS